MSHLDLSAPSSTTPVPFETILDQLEGLARDHLVSYRVQIGQLLLHHFWNGDGADFSSRDRFKSARFELFFKKNHEDLARYGLSKSQARRSIRAYLVLRTLPKAMAEQLFLTQILELARLPDPTQRAEVATVAIASDWTVQELRDAVSAVQAGLPLDTDPNEPGVQLPEIEPSQPAAVPGRLVTQAEKLVQEVDIWTQRWATVDPSRLRRPQRLRLRAAVVALEARVAALKAGLGPDEDT